MAPRAEGDIDAAEGEAESGSERRPAGEREVEWVGLVLFSFVVAVVELYAPFHLGRGGIAIEIDQYAPVLSAAVMCGCRRE